MTAPELDPRTEPFWVALRSGRLLLPECTACGRLFWYPRGFCPRCGSADPSWKEAVGTGSVYTFTVVRRGPRAADGPYVVAYVTLDEGLCLLANIVDCGPEAVRIGGRVRFRPPDSGEAGPPLGLRFRLVTEGDVDR